MTRIREPARESSTSRFSSPGRAKRNSTPSFSRQATSNSVAFIQDSQGTAGSSHPAPAKPFHFLDGRAWPRCGSRFLQQQHLEVPQPEPGRVGDVVEVMAGKLRQHIPQRVVEDRKSTRLNSSHRTISYAVFCL